MDPLDIAIGIELRREFEYDMSRDQEKPQFIVFYQKDPDFKEKVIFDRSKYIQLLAVRAWTLEEVFHMMQGEIWSPKGEARELITHCGLHHTSMCVGDVIRDCERRIYYMVCGNGFKGVDAYWKGEKV